MQDWNYKKIYKSPEANKNQNIIEQLFYKLYYCYLHKIKNDNIKDKNLYDFVQEQKKNNVDIKRILIDYIAGQTDNYFLKECEENIENFEIKDLY